ncbi:MAG: aldo/keto reductase [Acidimicrobiia bacterium]
MRYRNFGQSDLKVSEVGFGVWTLASDWWGRVDDPQAMLAAAFDAGINFFDTAPVYGDDAVGETLMADFVKAHRDEIVLTTKCGYDIHAERIHTTGHSERPQNWDPKNVREQLEGSLRRLGVDCIDLYQLHNVRIEPVEDDALWEELAKFKAEGKVRQLGVALGPAIGWVEEGIESVRTRDIVSLQTVFNILEQEPGLRFAREENVQNGSVGLISRVPHASDTLNGKAKKDEVFKEGDHRAYRNLDNMRDNFEKAETLAFLADGTGRTMGQAAVAGILANPAFTTVLPTCLSIDEVREYAAASDLPLSDDEARRLADLWDRNFDHEDRYVMPLKASR